MPRATPDTSQEVMLIANVAFLPNSSDYFVAVVKKVIYVRKKKNQNLVGKKTTFFLLFLSEPIL